MYKECILVVWHLSCYSHTILGFLISELGKLGLTVDSSAAIIPPMR